MKAILDDQLTKTKSRRYPYSKVLTILAETKKSNMKKCILICILLMGAMSIVSCSSRRAAINSLESLVQQVEKEGESYTMSDWDNVIRECAKVDKKLKKHEFTPEEKKEIAELQGRFAGVVTKDILIGTYNTANAIRVALEGGLEGLLEGLIE